MASTRFLYPSNPELFSPRQVLLQRKVSSFVDGRTSEGTADTTFQKADVAMVLYADGNEFDKCFDEATRMHVAFSSPQQQESVPSFSIVSLRLQIGVEAVF